MFASPEPVAAKPTGVPCARFNPRGDLIVTGCSDGWVRVWELGKRELPRLCFRAHARGLLYVSFSPDGDSIVTCSQDGTARLWNANTGEPLLEKPFSHGSWVYEASFSPDGHRMVTASYDKLAFLWNVETGALLASFQPQAPIGSASFSPDGRYIALGCWDYGSTTRIWEASAGGETRFLLRHTSYPVRLAYAPDGHRLAVAGSDGVIRLWDLAGNTVNTASEPVFYSSQGLRRASLHNGRLEIQSSTARRGSTRQAATDTPVIGVLLNPDGQRLLAVSASSAHSGTVLAAQVWDTGTARALGPVFALPWGGALAALSPDGTRLLAAHGSEARLWDTTLGRLLCDLPHSDEVKGASFSPVGGRFVTWAGTNVFLRLSENGKSICQIAHPSSVGHADFSPDGRHLITCSTYTQFRPGCAQLYDAQSGAPLGRQFWHSDGVNYAAFSPDGQRIVTASDDRSVRIWDRASGKQWTPPLVHQDQVRKACFSPDGRRVATLCGQQNIRIWETASGMPLTPTLRVSTGVEDFQFIEGGNQVLCTRLPRNVLALDAMFDDLGICDLSADDRPSDDLAQLAQVLSGRRGAELGAGLPLEREALQEGWRHTRQKHASDFVVSDNQARAWHQSEARISEETDNWEAALFHLRWLARLQSGDEDVTHRLSQAEAKLSAQRRPTR
jgi:WD40 repeat protein